MQETAILENKQSALQTGYKIFSNVFVVVLAVKLFDIVKNLAIASSLGVSANADVFSALINIPESLVIIAGLDTIRGIVNSEYAGLYTKNETELIKNSFSSLFIILFIVSLVLDFIILASAETIVKLLLPGFTGTKFDKAVYAAYIIFPIFFFKALAGYLHSVYTAVKRFYLPLAAPVIIGIFLLVSLYLPYYKGDIIYNLAIASLLGNAVLFIIMFSGIFSSVGRIRLSLKLDPLSKKIIKSCGTIFFLVVINQLYLFSRNFFASYFPEGAVSSISYAGTLPNVIVSLIFSSVFGILISTLSSISSSRPKIEAKKFFFNILTAVLFGVVPVIIIFIVYGREILSLVYQRGNFTTHGIEMTVKPFIWESLALFTFVIYNLTTALYLAKKKYRLLTILGCSVYLTGILLNYALSSYFGYWGISLAGFVTTGLYGIILLFYSRKFMGKYTGYMKEIALITLCGAVSFAVTLLLREYLFKGYITGEFTNMLVIVFVNGLIAASVYLLMTNILKVNYISRIRTIYTMQREKR